MYEDFRRQAVERCRGRAIGAHAMMRDCCRQAAQACSSCEQRFLALWHAHRKALRQQAARLSRGVLADDVVAEAFTVVWQRLDDVPTGAAPQRAWLRRVVALVSANVRRREARQIEVSRITAPHPSRRVQLADPVELKEAFLALQPSDRQVLWLAGVEGRQGEALASRLGCTVGAAAVRLSRARSRLLAQFQL
jgi:RNA polymerase sigma-70 factor (ECF subfamily)